MGESLTTTRKEQIYQVASKLFRERGFAATSMRDIAGAMSIEAASLYHHIRSKEDILDQICFGMAEKFINAIKEVNDIYFNAEERLRLAIQNHVEIMTGSIDQSAVFVNEWRSLQDPRLSDFKLMRDQYESELRVIIEEGEQEDLFEAVDKKFAVITILSAVNSIYQWYQPDGGMKPEEIAKKLSDFILGGLRKKLVTDINYKH